jgi:anti-sigma B factor antagonist
LKTQGEPMKLKDRIESNSVVVLELTGKIMDEHDESLLVDCLNKYIEQGLVNIVADLDKINLMNYSGLRILIDALSKMRKNEGDFKIANITDRIKSLLMITKFLDVFETFDSIDQAVESYNKKMQITVKADGDVTILRLKGKLLGEPETSLISDKVEELLESGCNKIVINMKEMSLMSGYGLLVLFRLHFVVKEGGMLRLSNIPKIINYNLNFEIFLCNFNQDGTEEDAVLALQTKETEA